MARIGRAENEGAAAYFVERIGQLGRLIGGVDIDEDGTNSNAHKHLCGRGRAKFVNNTDPTPETAGQYRAVAYCVMIHSELL